METRNTSSIRLSMAAMVVQISNNMANHKDTSNRSMVTRVKGMHNLTMVATTNLTNSIQTTIQAIMVETNTSKVQLLPISHLP